MIIHVSLKENGYDIVIEHGSLKSAGKLLNLHRKVFIVTDDGVPREYAESIRTQCADGFIAIVPQGEKSKSIAQYEALLAKMLELGFTRGDCVVAVGGGVIGDLAGFTAASYMRGIDFYNIPTTLLSQVDSSIGGKTAVNLNGVKNIVGSFYQPKKVLIDPDVLSTLPRRQINNGLAEALKMSLTCDKELFDIFEKEDVIKNLDTVIVRSLQIKRGVVEQDEKENGLRRILNFGHTIGHAIEVVEKRNGLYHGECIALGMLPMCSDELRQRVINIMTKIGLPTETTFDIDAVMRTLMHDKKAEKDCIFVTTVDKPGEYICKTLSIEKFPALFKMIQKR